MSIDLSTDEIFPIICSMAEEARVTPVACFSIMSSKDCMFSEISVTELVVELMLFPCVVI